VGFVVPVCWVREFAKENRLCAILRVTERGSFSDKGMEMRDLSAWNAIRIHDVNDGIVAGS
jgi:hypothetical protein